MSLPNMVFHKLQMMVMDLDATHLGCNVRIGELLRMLDSSCDQGQITLREWRSLLDKVVVVQNQLQVAG